MRVSGLTILVFVTINDILYSDVTLTKLQHKFAFKNVMEFEKIFIIPIYIHFISQPQVSLLLLLIMCTCNLILCGLSIILQASLYTLEIVIKEIQSKLLAHLYSCKQPELKHSIAIENDFSSHTV